MAKEIKKKNTKKNAELKEDKSIDAGLDKNKDKSDFQFYVVIGIILLIAASMIIGPTLYKKIFNKFEYAGVKFEKIKDQSGIVFYYGVFPINYTGKIYSYYNIYFRIDPRKNKAKLNTDLSLSKNVLVSLSENTKDCKDLQLGQITLGMFVGAFPFVKNATGGVYGEDYASSSSLPHISCANASPDDTVILVRNSEENSIEQLEDNCFAFNIGNCNYIETVEKFIIGAIAQINEVEI